MERTSHVPSSVKIKVVGLGGAGCNAITRMVREHIRGVEFIAMNTDVQHLEVTEAPVRIALGGRLTGGLGAGGDHNVGKRCAEEARGLWFQRYAGRCHQAKENTKSVKTLNLGSATLNTANTEVAN